MGKQDIFKKSARSLAKGVQKSVTDNIHVNINALGDQAVLYAKALVNVAYDGEGSEPPDPPKRRSGKLQAGIKKSVRTSAGGRTITLSITSTVKKKGRPYGLFLETGWKVPSKGLGDRAKPGRKTILYEEEKTTRAGFKVKSKKYSRRSLWSGTLEKVPPRPYMKPTSEYMMKIAPKISDGLDGVITDYLRKEINRSAGGRFGGRGEVGISLGRQHLVPDFRYKIQVFK